MNNKIIPIESIQERDVDLILLEELCTDISFCEWFTQELNLPKLTSKNGAWRSISDFGLGETDILFSYNSGEEKIYVLIENKLDASFQDNQFKRYQERALKYQQQGECNQSYVILVAPKLYCDNQNEFENYITYEAIADRLRFVGTKRNIFKSELLQIATEKLRRGYQPVNSEPVQKFWHEYWTYKEKNHPTLYMKEPRIVPQGSDWPMLTDNRLKNITFYHKWAQGNSDATFWGNPIKIKFKIKDNMPEGATLVEHGKSFSIRIFSGEVDRTKEFNDQLENVEVGITNLEKLRDWIIEANILTKEEHPNNKDMTIYEQIIEYSEDKIGQGVSASDIIQNLNQRYGTNPGSIIPSDYCYNRINNGIPFKQHVFEFLGGGRYKVLGEGYPYNGNIYHKPQESKEEYVVGKWTNGEYKLFDDINKK